SRGEERPYHGIEQIGLDLERLALAPGVILPRRAAKKAAPVRADIQAAWIDDQGRLRGRFLAVKDEDAMLVRIDRQIYARHRRNRARVRAGRVDDVSTAHPPAIRQNH